MKTYSQRAQLETGRNEQNGIKCLFPTRELHVLKCYYWEKGNWNSSKCRVWGEYLDKHVFWQETVRDNLCIDTGNETYTSRKVSKHMPSFNKDNVPGVISALGARWRIQKFLSSKSAGEDRFIQNMLYLSGKEPTCQCRRHKRRRSDLWLRKIPWKRAWQPTPFLFPRESHG